MPNLKILSITGMDCDFVVYDENGNDITNCWSITKIPKEIKNLKKLEYLSLTINGLQSLPYEIIQLSNLKIIDLTDNPGLQNIEGLQELKNLEELHLNGCNLSKLPENLNNWKKLKTLGLAGNNFNDKEKNRIVSALKNCEIYF